MRGIVLLAVLFGGANATTALAQPCRSYSADARQTTGETYDPANVSREVVRLEVRSLDDDLHTGCTSAPVSVRASQGTIQLRNGGTILNSEFIRSARTARITSSQVDLTGNAQGDIVREGQVGLDFLAIAPGQFVPPGTYVANLELVVGDAAPQPFQVAVLVSPSMRFELGTTEGTLDLEELTNGSEASSTFYYRTNASLSVTAYSDHGGRLRHDQGRSYGEIAYEAILSGRRLNLETPHTFTIANRSLGIQSEEIIVRVPPQQGRYAGIYRDNITLDFTAF